MSPYGTTVAHGFLTLSLVGALLRGAVAIHGIRLAINYGVNRVRFVAPTSGTDPQLKAMLGVPQAMASIMDKPKGSGQSIGKREA